jgi:hypothetical protein
MESAKVVEATPEQLAAEAITVLFKTGDVIELRVLGTRYGRKGTLAAGYFDDFAKLAHAIELCSEARRKDVVVEGIFWTLNPVDGSLLARYGSNVIQPAAALTTSDKEILRRTHLLIDADPVRPAGISSSDAEKQLAAEVVAHVKEELNAQNWSLPLEFDSGNGFHLVYSVDLPNDDVSRDLVKSCLVSLASRFDTPAVKIDTSVFNAARICKAYGSMARKGVDFPLRPHRRSRLLHAPQELKIVSVELLRALAAEAPATAQDTASESSTTPEKFEEQLAVVGVTHGERAEYQGGFRWHLDNCIFDLSHVRTSVICGINAKGIFYYHCSHNSCQSFGWKEFRSEAERKSGKKMRFKSPQALTDNQLIARFQSDPRARAAWNSQLEIFNNNAEEANHYLASFAQQIHVDVEQFVRVMQTAPLKAALEAGMPEYLRQTVQP